MFHYMTLNNLDRIKYIDKHVLRATLIEYKNKISLTMSEDTVTHIPGFSGKRKKPTFLKLNQEHGLLSIVNQDGLHLSTFFLTPEQQHRLVKDNFWVLYDKNT